MAAPTVTNTFVDATTASASDVNTNFTDIINALTDGSSDLTFGNLTAQGTAALNGNITLGNATTDTITYTGRVASDIDPTTAATYVLGSDTLPWAAIYLDNGATDGGAIYFDAGTAEYLKSNAAGTQLDVGSFTALNFTTTSDTTIGINGGTAIYIDDDDFVGIGVAPSIGRFDVKASAADTWVIAGVSSDGANLGGLYEESDTSGSLYLKDASGTTKIRLRGDGSTDHYINGGNLVLGATVAEALLHLYAGGTNATANANADEFWIEGSGNTGMTISSETGDCALYFGDGSGSAQGGFLYDHSEDTINFRAGNSVPAYFTSTSLGIGTQTPDNRLHIQLSDASATSHPSSLLTLERNGTTYLQFLSGASDTQGILFGDPSDDDIGSIKYVHSTSNYLSMVTNGTEALRLGNNQVVSMDVTNWGSGATQDVGISGTTGFSSLQKFTSSRRYKDNIKPYTFDTSKIYELVGKEFTWKSSGEWDFGAIAEEVGEVLPELVNYRCNHLDNDPEKPLEYELDAEGKKIPESIRYRQFTFVLLEELKKLKTRIEELERR